MHKFTRHLHNKAEKSNTYELFNSTFKKWRKGCKKIQRLTGIGNDYYLSQMEMMTHTSNTKEKTEIKKLKRK